MIAHVTVCSPEKAPCSPCVHALALCTQMRVMREVMGLARLPWMGCEKVASMVCSQRVHMYVQASMRLCMLSKTAASTTKELLRWRSQLDTSSCFLTIT